MEPVVTEKVESFFSRFALKRFEKGQILIHSGDQPNSIFYLVSGKVKQYDLTDRGDEMVLNVYKPPAFFPMSHAVNDVPNDYFFEADSDVEIRKAPIAEALRFIKENPDVLYDLMSRVYRGTDALLRRVAHLMTSTARSRLLYELMIESRRFGKPDGGQLALTVNETDLGARAGLSRETVSREIQKLKADGLIKVSNKQILVPNLERLETTLGQDLF
jgi:CRP-like cAMP-binding protein